jgi:hypothetical protein
MNRAAALTVAGLVLVVLLAALVILEMVRPAAWEEELAAYVDHARTTTGERVVPLAVVRARNPGRFDASLSHAVFGSSVYSHRALPYPAQSVYCVYVERSSSGVPSSRQVLFVVLHRDLHNADWVVHEGERDPLSERFALALKELDCLAPEP